MVIENDLEKRTDAIGESALRRDSYFDKIGGSIDDLVKSVIGLPAKVKEAAKTTYRYAKSGVGYSVLTGASYLSYIATGLAGPVTAGAMMLGRVLLDLKKGAKTNWDKLYKEGIKGIVLGNFAKLFYQYVINIIPNQTIYGKVGRALAYNPGFISSIYTPSYLKLTEALEGVKFKRKDWWKITKDVFLYNSPFHYLTANYLGGNVQAQAAASAGLGTAYRVIAG